MTFRLDYAVIHYFHKDAPGRTIGKVTKRPRAIPINHEPIVKLVSTLNGLLGERENSVVWGQFAGNRREGDFPQGVTSFLRDADNNNEAGFLNLSHTVIDELVKEAKKSNFATGGHILVAKFQAAFAGIFSDYLLVASIKERSGLALDKDDIPQDAKDIDLKKLNQAAKINLTKLMAIGLPENIQEEDEGDPDQDIPDETYLCFISPSQDREAAEYFINALGCAKGLASSRATDLALSEVSKFFDADADLKPFKKKAKDKVVDYLVGELDAGRLASVNGIFLAAAQAVPAANEVANDKVQALSAHLNSEGVGLPANFQISKKILEKVLKIKGKSRSDNWSLSFKTQALGDAASDIYYNAADGKLVLSNLDEAIKNKILAELALRAEVAPVEGNM